jgi:glycine hydroxymethyltransferase
MILSKAEFADKIARAVFPGVQGGPHEHTVAAKAVAFGEALRPEFGEYAKKVIDNAKTLSVELAGYGFRIVSGGTDNHLFLMDVFGSKGLSGKEAEKALEAVGVSVNKNMIPFDPRKPLDPSGIRIGTPAVTTRGMGAAEMKAIARIIRDALEAKDDAVKLSTLREEVRTLCRKFPIYA